MSRYDRESLALVALALICIGGIAVLQGWLG
jgi:hypothetical protein